MFCYSLVVKVAVQAPSRRVWFFLVLEEEEVVEWKVRVGRLCRFLQGIERLRLEGEVAGAVLDVEVVRGPWPFYSVVCRVSSLHTSEAGGIVVDSCAAEVLAWTLWQETCALSLWMRVIKNRKFV